MRSDDLCSWTTSRMADLSGLKTSCLAGCASVCRPSCTMNPLPQSGGFRGNQGEEEDVDVISVEPIAMIVPPELQDSPRTAAPEIRRDGEEVLDPQNHPDPSWDTERAGVLSVADGLEYEQALSQLTPNSIKFIIGFMLLCERLGMPAKAVVFRSLFLCRLCPSTSGMRWYYISGREKMMIFTNIRNKVARWKRQFVFVRDTRTDRINNELAARLSEWREGFGGLGGLGYPGPDRPSWVVDVANFHGEGEMSSILERQRQRAQGSRGRGAGSGSQRQSRFDERPPVAPGRSSQHRSSSSAQRLRAEQRVEPAPSSSRRRSREDADTDAEDDVPLIRRRTSTSSQPAASAAARPSSVPQALAREVAEAAPTSTSVGGPRIAYPDGFSYARTECQTAMLQGMQNFVPPADRLRAKGHVQQHGGHAALIKLMDVSILGEFITAFYHVFAIN
ncbi:hypothetical protein SLEP1_g39277 [Rubroshorea leprosula]|uniref:Uncharacterized protein n=1 Tax=Rubroshorea leprosula TaxID=152421 RepID=A0AAV5KZP6_9ROSI|nr:hypothetical protein SLEP1_g39277 [Rubroshorea leprosula]